MTAECYDFDHIFSTMRYPAGETHIAIRNYVPKNPIIVHSYCRNFEDLCNIRTANSILRNYGETNTTWFIPYFPFARHDRRRFKGDGLELTVAMSLMKDMNIVTLDPHSDVLGVLPHIPQSEVVLAADDDFEIMKYDPVIVIPDSGATKKAYTWANGKDIAQAYKVRDIASGALSCFEVDRENFKGKSCLIVDDICDGGGTFLGLAKILKESNAGPLTLVVSHGLFTKGTKELLEEFNRIITTSKTDSVSEDKKLLTISHAKLFQRGIFV